ncbi:MAG: hypothetical protein Q7T18_08425 [Sedimentisphaerales bacterium]|nr:hypothetical protein [Sedimentisphaerales bacterium]
MENKPQSLSAAISLIVVFLLPMAVFVGVALVCKHLLAPYITHPDLLTAISLVIAAAVTLAVLSLVKRVSQRRTKDK